MATTATAGIGALAGEIKFSDLRRTFLKMNQRDSFSDSETFDPLTGSVSASQLLRQTTGTDPNVPDCTENASIATTNNWKPSQFRNAIKYYYIQENTANVQNFVIQNQSWNGNLNRVVRKKMYLDGTFFSSLNGGAAARLTSSARNIRIDISGQIYGGLGQGGIAGGTTSSFPLNGGPGGTGQTALQVNASANNIVVFVRTTAEIFAGGGGGGGGGKGGTGGTGGGGSFSYQCGTQCMHVGGFCHGCPGAYQTEWCSGHCNPALKRAGILFCSCCQRLPINCTGTSSGGPGGAGGNGGQGGNGQGAFVSTFPPVQSKNSNAASMGGSSGSGGTGGGTNAGTGGTGGRGGNGGSGGNHGQGGLDGQDGDTGNTGFSGNRTGGTGGSGGGSGGNGGPGGSSITGANYNFTGTINTSGSNITIKGAIVGGTQIP